MPPKAGADIITARVARERSWALEAWTARLTWPAMRRLANLPESEGGLGYDLSESALKGLVLKAREDAGDLTMGRDERRERQSVEVDMRARAAREDMARAYSNGTRIEPPQRSDYYDPLDWVRALSAYADAVAATTRAVESADRRLEAAQVREAKLHGLDAPAEAKLDVTVSDATDKAIAELANDLERLARGKA